MKRLVLLSVLIYGSIYSMDVTNEVGSVSGTEQTLNQPDKPAWRCPDCGVSELPDGIQGTMVCKGCKKSFESIDIEGNTQDGKKAVLRFWFIKLK